ncbi:preprotein translocase subunit SecG [Sulfitobacter donghicola]|uniref:Protein-export membrane protein SecG n=1 Tax=Sulfitobacter donghicola DSW-25 = KCTC 12864 = JCM 14565 TaxID=1300350 RepID=A0A073IKA1_9RHOB|nr:preprotein translocase subunit SecG [Sulfitobacter donghicola]KEJ89990.1 preprotein translocase subunit SecG [Sulfitobacter donghicola DSW-25 = KCTC 12864 = JCM 14565]KIN66880.1 Preprotein translocase, SecG subunit [Sulfitobacter donghicola DSW-25 = KCTC 12864 = JCM 14565]
MENVVLIIHLILALGLIGVVLLQRSEGGGLGIGGGGGANSGRPPATPMSKVTWILGAAFVVTSITLTIVSAQKSAGVSVLDRLSASPPALNQGEDLTAPALDNLLPPAEGDNAPLVPTLD